jgi:hypothetical protein
MRVENAPRKETSMTQTAIRALLAACFILGSSFVYTATLKMEAIYFSETPVSTAGSRGVFK